MSRQPEDLSTFHVSSLENICVILLTNPKMLFLIMTIICCSMQQIRVITIHVIFDSLSCDEHS
jgi:hypothetical protein